MPLLNLPFAIPAPVKEKSDEEDGSETGSEKNRSQPNRGIGEGTIQPRLSHSKSESAAVRRNEEAGEAEAEAAINLMELDQYQLEPDEVVDESKSELI